MECVTNDYYARFHNPSYQRYRLEDLKVLRRSPDLYNNVKIGQGQLMLIIKHILFYHGVAAILVK